MIMFVSTGDGRDNGPFDKCLRLSLKGRPNNKLSTYCLREETGFYIKKATGQGRLKYIGENFLESP